jgi:hypothetical protein
MALDRSERLFILYKRQINASIGCSHTLTSYHHYHQHHYTSFILITPPTLFVSLLDQLTRCDYHANVIDILTVKYISKGNHAYDVGSVRSSRPVPRECPIYYYEITVHDPGVRGAITIGMAPEDFNLTRQTGSTPGSYGYRAEDGRKFDGTSRAGSTYGPLFALGDIVGCGINLYDNTIFFTKVPCMHRMPFLQALTLIDVCPSIEWS